MSLISRTPLLINEIHQQIRNRTPVCCHRGKYFYYSSWKDTLGGLPTPAVSIVLTKVFGFYKIVDDYIIVESDSFGNPIYPFNEKLANRIGNC